MPAKTKKKWLTVIFLSVILTLVAAGWFLISDIGINRRISHELELLLGGQVQIKHAHWEPGKGIKLDDVSLFLPDRKLNPVNRVFQARSITIDLPGLPLIDTLVPRQIKVDQGRLDIWYDRSLRQTNLQLLTPCVERKGGQCPTFFLNDMVVNLAEYKSGQLMPLFSHELEGTLIPSLESPDFHFEITQVGSSLTPPLIHGDYDADRQQCAISGGLLLNDALLEKVLADAVSFPILKTLNPTCHLTWKGYFDVDGGYHGIMKLHDGAINLPVGESGQLLPLTNIVGEIDFNKDGIFIKSISGGFKEYFEVLVTGRVIDIGQEPQAALTLEILGLDIPADQWIARQEIDNIDRILAVNDPCGMDAFLREDSPELAALLDAVYEQADPSITHFVNCYGPTGQIDVGGSLKKTLSGSQNLHWQASCEFVEGSIMYSFFPYPFDNFRGVIEFDATQTVIHSLSAIDDDRIVTVNGGWYNRSPAPEMDFTITMNNIPLDQRLYHASQPWQQELWDQFEPAGTINAVYRYNLIAGSDPCEALDIEVVDVETGFAGLDMRFTDLHGTGHYSDHRIVFDVQREDEQGGTLGLQGFYANLNQPDPRFECDILLDNILLDDKLIDNLPPAAQEKMTIMDISGRIFGRATLITGKEKPASDDNVATGNLFDYHISFTLEDGSLNYHPFPYPLENVQAQCEIVENMLKIESLKCQRDDSRIEMKGTIRNRDDYLLEIDARPLYFEDELLQTLKQKGLDIERSFDPCGPANLYMWVHRQPDKEPAYMAVLEPKGARLCWSKCPYPLENVTGQIEIKPESILLKKLLSVQGEQKIRIAGEIPLDTEDAVPTLSFHVEKLVLDEKLGATLPESVTTLYERVKPSGKINMALELRGVRDEPNSLEWDMQGTIQPENMSVRYPCEMTAIQGPSTVQARFDAQGNPLTMELRPAGMSMELYHRELKDLSGKMVYDYATRQAIISNVSGSLFTGRIAGEAVILLDDNDPAYEFDVNFLDGDLAALFPHLKNESSQFAELRGTFRGRLHLQKNSGDELRRGSYEFFIKDAVMGRLPLIARLLHFINLTAPRAGAFNQAEIAGDIVNGLAHLTRIKLDGSAVKLTGGGIIKKPFFNGLQLDGVEETPQARGDGQGGPLELYFVLDAPDYLPDVPVLTSFYKAISPELMQVRVSGHFYDPKIESVAFPSLEQAVRNLESRERNAAN